MKTFQGLTSFQWFEWVAATVVAAISIAATVVAFAYNEFETKEHAKESKEAIIKQLDSIESKIDKASDKIDRLKK